MLKDAYFGLDEPSSEGTPKPLVIIGAGGFGREVFGVVAALNRWRRSLDLLGFLDDGEVQTDLLHQQGTRLIGPSEDLRLLDTNYVIAIGLPDARRRIDQWASGIPRQPDTLVHPDTTVGSCVIIGAGSVVMPGARLTTNIVLGRHVHVDQNATIGHDCLLDSYSRVNPGAALSGHVHLEIGAVVGAGAVVLQGLTIGEGAVVGAGAVVVRNVAPNSVVAGVPAAPIR